MVVVVAYYVLPFDDQRGWNAAPWVAIGVVVIVGTVLLQYRAVVRSDRPVLRAIEAAATSAVVLVVVFAAAYQLLSTSDAEAFSEPMTSTTALYFTLTTLSTVGFGDIVARSDAARITVMVQMVANVLVIGVVVRALVQLGRRRSEQT